MAAPAPPRPDPPAAKATAAAFAVALALGLAAGVLSLARAPAADWAGMGDLRNLASGESGARLSRIVNERFAPRVALERLERGVSWLALGDLGSRVRGGCPGWLFLKDELEIHPDPAGAGALRAQLAARVAQRLAAKGAALLVVVVPDKSRVERERLCGLRRPPAFEGRVGAWTRELAAAGVAALDLTAALERLPGERYYRTDSHWNEAGAHAAAREIARALRARGLASGPVPPEAALATERVRRPGDLVRVAGLDWLPDAIGPGAEWTERATVPAPQAASDDLFGAAGLPQVALVGSSYSRSAGFAAFLAWQLGEQVANAAREGADFDGAARAYLEGATLREAAPRVVVWEVPERAIGIPVKPGERQWLESLGAAPSPRGRAP